MRILVAGLALALVGVFGNVAADRAPAYSPSSCAGVKSVSVVHGKRVVSTKVSCPAVKRAPVGVHGAA